MSPSAPLTRTVHTGNQQKMARTIYNIYGRLSTINGLNQWFALVRIIELGSQYINVSALRSTKIPKDLNERHFD